MPLVSAGWLICRFLEEKLQMFLAHPGTPLCKNPNDRASSIPKGEVEPSENLLEPTRRDSEEEITDMRPETKVW
jgi:predicted NUDIX family NTP pyrophosphohydrolase